MPARCKCRCCWLHQMCLQCTPKSLRIPEDSINSSGALSCSLATASERNMLERYLYAASQVISFLWPCMRHKDTLKSTTQVPENGKNGGSIGPRAYHTACNDAFAVTCDSRLMQPQMCVPTCFVRISPNSNTLEATWCDPNTSN